MKFLTCTLLVLFVTTHAKEPDVAKEKRSPTRASSATTAAPSDEQSAVAYSSAKVTQQTQLPSGKGQPAVQYVQQQQQPQVVYVQQPQPDYKYAQVPQQAQFAYAPVIQHSQQQQQQLQQHQQYEQPIQYIQQTVSKSAQQQPALTKLAYTSRPSASVAVPYSSAADVSSFSYSSPFVSYNNLGLLSQAVGKIATQSVQPVKLAAAPQYPTLKAVSQQQPQAQQHVQYVQAPVQVAQHSSEPVTTSQQFFYQPTKSATVQQQQQQHQQQQQYVIASPQSQYNFAAPKNFLPQYAVLPQQQFAYNVADQKQLQALQQLQAQPQYQYVSGQEQQGIKEVHEPKANPQSVAYTVAPNQLASPQAYTQQPIAYTAQPQKSGVTYA